MHFLVIGHVVHKFSQGQFFAYGPYVREMNRWFTFADQVTVVSPVNFSLSPDPIDLPYIHQKLQVVSVPEVNLLSAKSLFRSILNIPLILFRIGKAMRKADHIQLRCPGNYGLLGAIVQVFFPGKMKSAKYAGNWDRNAPKPFTYKLQQNILSSTFWSKNMTVLVYGNWPNESKNIKPFFTASYSNQEISPVLKKGLSERELIRLIFVGGLVSGKNPILAAEVVLHLKKKGYKARLDMYGEGAERSKLEEFIQSNQLDHEIQLKGNVPSDKVKEAFKESHFLIFISNSEGWPKVVAESMFWGCVPVTTRVSCVPQMLGEGERGVLIDKNSEKASEEVIRLVKKPEKYHLMSDKAANWSRQYTLENFEEEIGKIIKTR